MHASEALIGTPCKPGLTVLAIPRSAHSKHSR